MEGKPEHRHGTVIVQGAGVECGVAWSGWNLEYLEMGRGSGCWSRLRFTW